MEVRSYFGLVDPFQMEPSTETSMADPFRMELISQTCRAIHSGWNPNTVDPRPVPAPGAACCGLDLRLPCVERQRSVLLQRLPFMERQSLLQRTRLRLMVRKRRLPLRCLFVLVSAFAWLMARLPVSGLRKWRPQAPSPPDVSACHCLSLRCLQDGWTTIDQDSATVSA